MQKELFYQVWDRVVVPVIASLDEILSSESCQGYEIKKRDVKKVKKQVYHSYQKARKYIKTYLYASKQVKPDDNNVISYTTGLMDYHKIGSCLCKSLLENQLYKIEYVDGMPFEVAMLNYYLAYHSSLSLVYYYVSIAYHYMDKGLYDKWCFRDEFLAGPTTSAEHDSYHKGRIKVLAQCDLYQQSFDLLMYSDMLFWLEYYNRQIVENKIQLQVLQFPNKKELDPLWAE